MGYSHIPKQYAQPINDFYQTVFNPWLNEHRPCMFAIDHINAKGKVVKRYRHSDVKTPLAKLMELASLGLVTLKKGVSLHDLHRRAGEQTDLAAAQQMQAAKSALFTSFNKPRKRA